MENMNTWTWSNDRGCWITDPPSGHGVCDPPKGMLLVGENIPTSVCEEWTTSWTDMGGADITLDEITLDEIEKIIAENKIDLRMGIYIPLSIVVYDAKREGSVNRSRFDMILEHCDAIASRNYAANMARLEAMSERNFQKSEAEERARQDDAWGHHHFAP